jgi:hypothetical protein
MENRTLEDRVAILEAEVARLKASVPNQSAGEKKSNHAWLEQVFGSFADDPAYDEAMRLGRAYRESLRPKTAKPRKS